MAGGDDINSLSSRLHRVARFNFLPLEVGEKLGTECYTRHSANSSSMVVKKKTSAMHITHAFTRALARMWLGLNGGDKLLVALHTDYRQGSNAASRKTNDHL